MGKYILYVGNDSGPAERIEADFLPKQGEEYLYEGKIFHVEKVRHRTFKEKGELETRVEVHLKR